jgi:hypothetical protein
MKFRISSISGKHLCRVGVMRSIFAIVCYGILVATVSTPRAQDEISDFTGLWWGGAPRPVLPGDPPKKDEPLILGGGIGVKTFPVVLTEHGESVMADFDPLDDPAVRCEHPGLVRAVLNPYPMKLEQVGDDLVFIYEEWATERPVHMGSEMPEELEHSTLGYSTGRLDGGKLVVRSSGMTRGLNMAGQFLWVSEEASIVEEYSINERGQMIMEFTLTDPVMLKEPWRVEKIFNPYDQEPMGFECETRERPGPAGN